jgi:riboflavin kinase/FMN adenylyltransferase
MRVYRNLAGLPPDFGPSAVTIGNFDGVHRGHCEILRRVKALADARGWKASVLTFDPHPTKVVAPERSPKLMTTPERRAELMAQAGVEQILILPFDRAIAQWSPEEFVRRLLVDRLGARAVLVGDNFRFGCRQAGDTRTLEALGRQLGFVVEIAPAVTCRGQVVSSSGIRSLLCAGRIGLANRFLGRPYALEGEVVSGRGVGSKQTVPTLNLATSGEVIPARGVYVTRTRDLDSARAWTSVTNVGYRPTFGESDQLSIESFLLTPLDAALTPAPLTPDASTTGPLTAPLTGDAPGRIRVEFLARLRSERQFESPEALKAQILRDVRNTQSYFRRTQALTQPLTQAWTASTCPPATS